MVRTFTDNDDRRRILESTDIVGLVGEHLALKPKGREFVGLCPFHDDHKPSMYVVPAKQIYHCFSCGAGGNAIDFVMNYHKMEFIDALRFLADRSGLELTPRRAPRADAQRLQALGDARNAPGDLVIAVFAAHEIEQRRRSLALSRCEEHLRKR